MTPEEFRKWLASESKRLGRRQAGAELYESDYEAAAETIRLAGEMALQAHVPGAYEVSAQLKAICCPSVRPV